MGRITKRISLREYRIRKGVEGEKGPNGRILCACGRELKGRQQSWCGQDCAVEYLRETWWPYIRGAAYRRDDGKCVDCGVDFEKIERILKHVRELIKDYREWRQIDNLIHIRCFDLPPHNTCRDLYDTDHIIPVCQGGTDELSNARTLCLRCHKKRTRALARQRAGANISQEVFKFAD